MEKRKVKWKAHTQILLVVARADLSLRPTIHIARPKNSIVCSAGSATLAHSLSFSLSLCAPMCVSHTPHTKQCTSTHKIYIYLSLSEWFSHIYLSIYTYSKAKHTLTEPNTTYYKISRVRARYIIASPSHVNVGCSLVLSRLRGHLYFHTVRFDTIPIRVCNENMMKNTFST